MTDRRVPAEAPHEAARYAIRIKGHLDDGRSSWLDGLTIRRKANGETLLAGPVVDQAALFGLLRKVRDLGMPLISVTRIGPEEWKETEG